MIKGNIQKEILITPLGIKVLEYLRENFMDIIHEKFTSQVESDLDLIANGKLVFVDVIRKVYESFIHIVDSQIEKYKLKCKSAYGR